MTNPHDSHVTRSLRITGRVQGVWFRAWTRDEARARGLSGWVRNTSDGAVEALISGAPDDVKDMVAALHRGPPSARVAAVRETERAEPPRAEGFRILR